MGNGRDVGVTVGGREYAGRLRAGLLIQNAVFTIAGVPHTFVRIHPARPFGILIITPNITNQPWTGRLIDRRVSGLVPTWRHEKLGRITAGNSCPQDDKASHQRTLYHSLTPACGSYRPLYS